jgi:hypothetical protein
MNEQEDNDPRLDTLLKEWKIGEPLPPRFQESVWRRIEDAQAGSAIAATRWRDRLATIFARPAIAAVCAALLLMAGLTAGFWRGNHDSVQWDKELAHRYVAAIDPFAQ